MATHILIIEDDESLVELMSARLRKAGHEIRVATDAMLGTKMALQTPAPDLVLLDLKMPAGGGLAVLKSLRGSVLTKHIPVVVITGNADAEAKAKLLQYGIKTYLQKPFTADDLMSAIESP